MAADLELTAVLQQVQLMGDNEFITPEVEDIAKDLQAIQQDVQVAKASPQQPTEKVTYKFHVSKLNNFLKSDNLFAKNNIRYPTLFLSIPQDFAVGA